MNLMERLQTEQGALLARLSEIEAIIREHEILERRAAQVLGGSSQVVVTPTSRPPTIVEPRPVGKSRPSSPDIVESERVVTEILSNAPKPVDRHALLALVLARGVQVGGQIPVNTLGTRVSRMSNVSNLKGSGYWLKTRLHELMPQVHSAANIDPLDLNL